jgi:hypothetical protein
VKFTKNEAIPEKIYKKQTMKQIINKINRPWTTKAPAHTLQDNPAQRRQRLHGF